MRVEEEATPAPAQGRCRGVLQVA